MAKHPLALGLIISFLLTIIFLTNFSFNLTRPIDLSHFDTFHAILTMNHYYKVLESGNFNQILTVPMFYGFENSLLFGELFLLQSILGLPIFFLTKNIVFTYHLLILLTMTGSFFSMYLLAFFFTKKAWPSVLAAIVYTFNPFVFGHFPDNIHYLSIQWIPLILLYFEKSLQEKTNKNVFLFFLFLILQLLSSITYGALLTVILPIYVIIRLYQTKTNPIRFINKGFIIGAFVFAFFSLDFAAIYLNYYSKQPIGRTLEETAVYGPWVSDLFFTNPNNLVYGGLRTEALKNFPDFVYAFSENAERNLFWGIVPLVLFLVSFKVVRKTGQGKLWWLFTGLVVFNVWLSLGPVIRFSTSFALPGIYSLFHAINPLLQNLRVASRFTIFTALFLGLICALALNKLTERYSRQKVGLISLLVVSLVLLEYWQKPWPFYQVPDETKVFYSSLEGRRDIQAILELPMGNLFTPVTLAKNQFVDATYMFWASTLHNKKLLNGYSSYTPPEYIKRIEYLTVNFPTLNKLEQLKKWGVDAIVLHKDEFQDPRQFEENKLRLKRLGVSEIISANDLVLFNLKAWTKGL